MTSTITNRIPAAMRPPVPGAPPRGVQTVHVVTWKSDSIGGFDWRYNPDNADRCARELRDPTAVVYTVPDVPGHLRRSEITEYLDDAGYSDGPGDHLPRHVRATARRVPYAGMPATINLYTDTIAAVVTRVTPRTVTVARVNTTPDAPDTMCDPGAYGIRPTRAEGILDQPIEGTEERYTLNKHGRYVHGTITLTLGRSVRFVDYRF